MYVLPLIMCMMKTPTNLSDRPKAIVREKIPQRIKNYDNDKYFGERIQFLLFD